MAEKQSTLMPTSTAISSSSTKHVFLHEWWLVNAKGKGGSSGGLAVGGFAHRDGPNIDAQGTQRVSLFCSAPISKRLDATAVLARDGIAISLNGLINLRHTTNNGYSMEVCNKFMVGFPYDWDDYATYHAHQSCGAHADVSDKSKCYSNMEKSVTDQSSLEDVPVTSIRDMPKRNDLKNLMDDILTKAGSPKENDEPRAKFVAKGCLKASPVIEVVGYNHDQVRNAEDGMVTPSKKEQQNTCLQGEEAVCSPNKAGVCKRSAKRCLKASPGKDEAGYNHNQLETASSKKRSRCSQPEEAVNCHNLMANSERNMRSIPKASLIKGMAGQDQDWLVDTDRKIVTPSKKDQSSCYQREETISDSHYQTSISPRRIKSCLRASIGIDATGREHSQLHDTDDEIGTSSSKGQSSCLQLDSAVNPHSRSGVSTRSMTNEEIQSPEDVPVTSIRDMPKRNDLKILMDDILAKAGSPKENDEPRAKFVAKICLEASPVIDVAGNNHDQVRNAEDGMVTPSKKEQHTCLQGEEAVCSPNKAGVCKRSSKRCLKASPGKDEAGYNHNQLETASSKKRSHCSQLEEAVNCHNRMANSARNMRSVPRASLIKGMAGQDQDWLVVDTDCEIVNPWKKEQSSCYQLEETIFDSHYQTRISPRRIKSCLRSSMGIDTTGREHNRLHDTKDEIGTSSSKGQSRCLQLDSTVNPHSRSGVSTRSMTRLKKYNG